MQKLVNILDIINIQYFFGKYNLDSFINLGTMFLPTKAEGIQFSFFFYKSVLYEVFKLNLFQFDAKI